MPFKLLKRWPEILEQFTTGDIYNETASLYLKRDALLHKGIEKSLVDKASIKLLYEELVFNIAYSFYPCTVDEAVEFAANAFMADYLNEGTKSHLNTCVGTFLPPHLESKVWGWSWRKKVWSKFCSLKGTGANSHTYWRRRYIEMGFRAPFYGATFFYGGLENEKPGYSDVVVRVGVNLDGIHVINDKLNEVVLTLPYDEFTFNSFQGRQQEDSFVIEYEPHEGKVSSGSKETMVIWSAQSNMIDTLVMRNLEVRYTGQTTLMNSLKK